MRKLFILITSLLVVPFIISFITWEIWPGKWNDGTRVICLIASFASFLVTFLTVKNYEKYEKKDICYDISKEEKRDNKTNDFQTSYDNMMHGIRCEIRENSKDLRNKKIYDLYNSNVSHEDISEKFKLSLSQVYKIINKEKNNEY